MDEKSHALKLRCPSFLAAELGDGPASELFVVGNGPPATELCDGDGLLRPVSVLVRFHTMELSPFPRCLKPLFQSETECKAIDMEMIFKGHTNKTHFHKKGTVLHFKPL